MAEKYKTFLPYRQVILCNLVLVVVPILIIISKFWAQMSNPLRREVLAMRAANQEQIQESVDFMLKNFESMAAYASLDGDLRPYELRRNNYATVTALKHLKQHASALSEMQILFHISSDSHFYSAQGRFDFATFERLYRFEGDWTPETFYEWLAEPGSFKVTPAGCALTSTGTRGDRFIALLYPWNCGSASFGTVIGLMREDWFESRLIGEEHDLMCILNAQGELLFGGSEELGAQTVAEIQAERPAAAEIDGRKWNLVWRTSPLNGWTYLTAVSEEHILSMLFDQQTMLTALVLVLLLCFSGVGVALAMRYYLPVRNLRNLLGPSDESALHDRVETILRDNEDMRVDLEETWDYLAEEFLAQLAWGRMDEAECSEQLRRLNLSLPGPDYAMLAIRLGTEGSAAETESAMSTLRGLGLLATESHSGGEILALFEGAAQGERFADETAAQIAAALARPEGAKARIGVGRPCQSLTELSRSFIEAAAVLNSNLPGELLYFDGMVENRFELLDKPLGDQRIRLSEAIRQGDAEAVAQACDELCACMEETVRRTGIPGIRFMMDGILIELLPFFSEAGLKDVDWEINLAVHAAQPKTFVERLRPVCIQAAQRFGERRDNWCNRKISEILRYIDAHYCENDLSQASVAAMFDLTPTSLSRMFSESMGCRFIDYVSRRRMNRAAELLRETELGVREIVAQVGYIDVSSFTRKFTAHFGKSPAAFREQAQSGEEAQAAE